MITQEEKNRRQKVIDFARGNVRYEGVILSEEVETNNQRYINGELSDEEHSALGKKKKKKEFELRKSQTN